MDFMGSIFVCALCVFGILLLSLASVLSVLLAYRWAKHICTSSDDELFC